MLKIGLTGGIGSGKSTVARIFIILGAEVYFSDSQARFLMKTNPFLRAGIVKLLGDEAYSGEEVNADFISRKIFNNKELLKQMNALVHPVVRRDFSLWCQERTHLDYVIQESALLFETGFYKEFDYTVIVDAPRELRIERVVQRDGVDRGKVTERMNNQSEGEERSGAGILKIINDGRKLLIPQVLELHNKFVSLQKA